MLAVKMVDVTKKYDEFIANDKINISIEKGTIHAILGENGAGKSTLMNTLFGLHSIDGGYIEINGKRVEITSPLKAQDLGIGMVHQHFMLVDNFSVLQNIILGNEPTKKGKLYVKDVENKLNKLITQYNFDLNLKDKNSTLTVSQEQKVEILKVLYKDLDILIFDEPTAVLTPQETEEFLNILKQLRDEGKTIILITHKLGEIKAVASKCSIIRQGKLIDTVEVVGLDEMSLANMMVGKEIDLTINKKEVAFDEKILEIKNLGYKDSKNVQRIKNINLDVYKGKILGIAGVDNNGQSELVEVLTGLISSSEGSVEYLKDGEKINLLNKSIRDINKGIISHIPQDRIKDGLVLEYNIAENAVLMEYYKDEFSKGGILNKTNINNFGEEVIKKYDVRSGRGIESKCKELSGGNQQKLIIGRQIELDADIIIAFQPTRGVDVGAIKFIHDKLIEQRDQGKAILLLSLELNEIMSLSDEIAVIHDGEIIDVIDAKDVTKDEVGLMMAGKKVLR